jgi:hypothetical protein
MLQESPHRPWSLKQRILGRHGHLSNEAAADAAEQVMSAHLQHLYLGHLSRECNRPEIAKRVMEQRLEKIGAGHVRLESTSQIVPGPTLHLEKPATRLPTDNEIGHSFSLLPDPPSAPERGVFGEMF